MFLPTTPILIIDDSDVMVNLIKNELGQMGYSNVQTASNGKVGLEMIAAAVGAGTPFDLLFVDWNMPEMSGVELLVQLRALPHGKDVTFIMVTGQATKKDVVEAIQKGANGYILKPFTRQSFSEAMSRSWQGKGKKVA